MAKRNPEKTARNKKTKELTQQLKVLLPQVLLETGASSELSLHAYFATRKAEYIDLKHEVIHSAEHYISLFIKGLKEDLLTEKQTEYRKFYECLMKSDAAKKYLYIFFHRTYLREYENLSKNRPQTTDSQIWIGQNNADYGLLITPRFVKGLWENDNSEIRRFKPRYWSIGHVLNTGLVVPDKDQSFTFSSVEEYLKFFENVLVRHSGSSYQKAIAALYSKYVSESLNPENVLLLIPELRYNGKDKQHMYRLDYCVIDVETNNKIGFELSPWSSHGKIAGTKGKKQKDINQEASENFDKEMKKHKDYFKKHGIFTLIYTDADLQNIDGIFSDIKKYIEPKQVASQLEFHMLSEFFN